MYPEVEKALSVNYLQRSYLVPFLTETIFTRKPILKKWQKAILSTIRIEKGWLQRLNQLALEHNHKGAVIVCSALKHKYRKTLTDNLNNKYRFVFLKGSMELINKRLSKRKGHYMPKTLLKSQFEALEKPTNALEVDIKHSPEEIVDFILKDIQN